MLSQMGAEELPPAHPVRILMEEHDQLLGFLSELELAAAAARKSATGLEVGGTLRTSIHALALTLLDAEPHHQREEQGLFPRMERIGIEGPPHMMRMEHEILRAAKRSLAEQMSSDAPANEAFVAQLCRTTSDLVGTLRAHIQKENRILYPMALEALSAEDWREIATDCERIGPCSFSKWR
ncbi:MAG: hemerythrin domain-containing protein [Deltaproteobacteria bacterium]|nr:hemerythrin domain-containing protein [Deltaproteobacteria bacterium]